MTAAVYQQYGSPEVLQVKQVEKPAPQPHEILIKVRATAVTSGDCRLRRADPFAVRFVFGLFKPRISILGDGFSGIIEAVGEQVTRFKPGDEVFGTTGLGFGSYAAYVCVPETGVVALKPHNMSHEEAATIHFGAATALHFVRKTKIGAGQQVLVLGASGAVGTAVVQLAKSLGAEVTGVCSTANVDLVKAIGADHVLDYRKDDLALYTGRYDVVVETVDKYPIRLCRSLLRKQGTLALVAALLGGMLQGLWISLTTSHRVVSGVAIEKLDDLLHLRQLIEAGQLHSVIDRVYALADIAEAHAYVDDGHKKGNVAIQVGA